MPKSIIWVRDSETGDRMFPVIPEDGMTVTGTVSGEELTQDTKALITELRESKADIREALKAIRNNDELSTAEKQEQREELRKNHAEVVAQIKELRAEAKASAQSAGSVQETRSAIALVQSQGSDQGKLLAQMMQMLRESAERSTANAEQVRSLQSSVSKVSSSVTAMASSSSSAVVAKPVDPTEGKTVGAVNGTSDVSLFGGASSASIIISAGTTWKSGFYGGQGIQYVGEYIEFLPIGKGMYGLSLSENPADFYGSQAAIYLKGATAFTAISRKSGLKPGLELPSGASVRLTIIEGGIEWAAVSNGKATALFDAPVSVPKPLTPWGIFGAKNGRLEGLKIATYK